MECEPSAVEVTIVAMSGERIAELRLGLEDVAVKVKLALQEECGYPKESQQLLHQGDILDDKCALAAFPNPLVLTLVLSPFETSLSFVNAVENGHTAAVRTLLKRVVRDDQDHCEMLRHVAINTTAMQVAAGRGHAPVCQLLLESAQSPGERRSLLLAPVLAAAKKGQAATCQTLLEAAPLLEDRVHVLAATDAAGWTALHRAAHDGSASQALLRAASDEEMRLTMLAALTPAGWTALHLAARTGHEVASKALLEAAPSPARRRVMLAAMDCEGRTALHHAAGCYHEVVCQALLEAAPNLEARTALLAATDAEGATALHLAAEGGDEMVCGTLLGAAPSEEVMVLLQRELVLLLQLQPGCTALHLAAHWGHDLACQALLEASRSQEERSEMLMATRAAGPRPPCHSGGSTALHVAANCNHEKVCEVLLEAAPMEVRSQILAAVNGKGQTALQVAGASCRVLLHTYMEAAACS